MHSTDWLRRHSLSTTIEDASRSHREIPMRFNNIFNKLFAVSSSSVSNDTVNQNKGDFKTQTSVNLQQTSEKPSDTKLVN